MALWAPNSARWIATSFGVYLAGAVLVPINTRFKGMEAAHVLRRSEAGLLSGSTDVLGTDLVGLLDDVGELPALRETVVLEGPGRPDGVAWDAFSARADGSDGGSIAQGGGTAIWLTSSSRRAQQAHPRGRCWRTAPSVRTYQAWSDAVGLVQGDRYLCVYPFFHTAGLKSAILACVLKGATVLPHPVFDPAVVMERVSAERISVLPGPPTVFQSMLEHPDRSRYDLSTLRLSVTGAATVPVEVVRRMREDLKIATVVTGYGLTETTGTVSMCRYDDPPEVIATTVGKPLDGVSVRVVDDDGNTLPSGSPGEILVRGFNIMLGYFADEEATAAAIDKEGWLRTGDIGLVDDDGNLHITDRKKDMFIVGGFNAFPAEIEGIMLTHPSVAQVAVVGVPDERLGEVGQAFVVPRVEDGAVDEATLVAWCRDHMANYKVPRHIAFVDELPLTASGKVQRFRLRPSDA